MSFNALWHWLQNNTINSFAFAPAACKTPEAATLSDGASISIPIGTTVDEATKRLVRAAIEQCAGNKLKAARMLGIPPRTMYRHFLGHGIVGIAAKMAVTTLPFWHDEEFQGYRVNRLFLR